MVKATSWDGWTGPVRRNERCFVGRRYTSRNGTVAPGNPEIEPELTPYRRVSHRTIRPIPLSPRSIPHSRPSLFENQPAGRILAQNNRNCGEINVPPGLSLVDHCGALKSDKAPRRAGTLLYVAEFSLLSIALASSRGWFDFSAFFSISLHFNADCTRHQVPR